MFYARPKKRPKLPKHHQECLEGYIEFCRYKGLRESTIARNVDYCRKTLLLFWERGIRDLQILAPKDVHSALMESKSKTNFHS